MEFIYSKNNQNEQGVYTAIKFMAIEGKIGGCKVIDISTLTPELERYLISKRVRVTPTLILENGNLVETKERIEEYLISNVKTSGNSSHRPIKPYMGAEMKRVTHYSYVPPQNIPEQVKRKIEYALPPGENQRFRGFVPNQ